VTARSHSRERQREKARRVRDRWRVARKYRQEVKIDTGKVK
jgi:hypothetical protein